MSRPPPTAPARSRYITGAGFDALRAELDGLWVRRRDVVRHLSAAAAEGDRSENAEYIYRKKELRGIDRRIRYLQRRLPELVVVRQSPTSCDRVFFGAWVTLADANGGEVSYRLVGSDELDPARNWISIDSPMARALLGRSIDEEVRVVTPAGPAGYHVVQIAYEAPPDAD